MALSFSDQRDGPPEFNVRQGWLRNFKFLHDIRELEIEGESLSSNETAGEIFKETFVAFFFLSFFLFFLACFLSYLNYVYKENYF